MSDRSYSVAKFAHLVRDTAWRTDMQQDTCSKKQAERNFPLTSAEINERRPQANTHRLSLARPGSACGRPGIQDQVSACVSRCASRSGTVRHFRRRLPGGRGQWLLQPRRTEPNPVRSGGDAAGLAPPRNRHAQATACRHVPLQFVGERRQRAADIRHCESRRERLQAPHARTASEIPSQHMCKH